MTANHTRDSVWRDELMPHTIDHLAKLTPDAPYAQYPNSPLSYDQGYHTVTYKQLANAVNGLAWWLNKNLGASTNFDVLAYVGPNDVRYFALTLGAIKAGYVAFLTSPRNSPATHAALFKQLNCNVLLTSSPTPPPAQPILKSYPLKHLEIPSLADLLQQENPHYQYKKEFATAATEPFVILHTSGSTGTPKPMIWTHNTVAIGANIASLTPPPGFQSLGELVNGKRILNPFPPFHAACLAMTIVYCVPFGSVSICPLSGPPPTAEGVVQILKHAPADVAYLAPSIAADLAKSPALLESCAQQLELVVYVGGDLPQALGDAVAAKIPMHCHYGASELGLVNQIFAPDFPASDWRFVRFHPALGFDFEEANDGLFELVVKRRQDLARTQLPFSIQSLKDLDVYRSRDLYEKHPTIPGYWSWRARADDIIVFLNGLKTNPVSFEQQIVASNPEVSAVMVIGTQRFQAALLVEPATKMEKSELIEKIWPSIEEANAIAPTHARIDKNMILISSPEKPLVRSGKGAVQRPGVLAQYSAEIDDLYLRADTELTGVERASIDIKDPKAVSKFIQQAISDINPGLLRDEADNLFESGMDSLVSVRLVRLLRHGLGQPDFNVSDIHNNPSVKLLTQRIVGTSGAPNKNQDFEKLKETYNEAIRGIKPTLRSATGEVVLLTGSTGSLGTQLLEELLTKPDISHVYCLNRKENARQVHQASSEKTGFQFNQYEGRVSFFKATLDQPNLGLDDKTYTLLRSTVTSIIHCAWSVNFIMPLGSFKPHLDGLMNLFRMMADAPTPPKLLHISSISSASEFEGSTRRTIPEEVIHDAAASLGMGYAKSKLLSEILCDTAARSLRLPISFVRVGQVAGRVSRTQGLSLWNTAEWLPSLVITSISMGALPDNLGAELSSVAWMPSDLLAASLVELSAADNPPKIGSNSGAQVFNLVNPNTATWDKIAPMLVASIHKYSNKTIDIIPRDEWLAKLGQVSENFSTGTNDLARIYPAIKLQGFYEWSLSRTGEPVTWKMERAKRASSTISSMPAIGQEWIDRWVEAWVKSMG